MPKPTLQRAASRATAAYQSDMARRGPANPFGPDDEGWLAVATLLAHAASPATDIVTADALLSDASDLAQAILSTPAAHPFLPNTAADTPFRSPANPTPASPFARPPRRGGAAPLDPRAAILEQLALHVEHAGALNLAAAIYQSIVIADPLIPAADRGRLLVFHGRVLRKLGRVDEAIALYDQAAQLARQTRDPELQAHVHMGYGGIAQARGDFATLQRHARRAARVAQRHDLTRLLALANQALMVAAQKSGDVNAALVYAWSAFQLSADNVIAQDDALTNVGQLLVELGDYASARSAYTAVLSRPQPARVALPVLGGLAIAAARLDDRATLAWATTQLLDEVDRVDCPYETAHALMECAAALRLVGRIELAGQCRDRALPIAERYGFKEVLDGLTTHQDGVTAPAASVDGPAGSRARIIARKVRSLASESLPARIRLRGVA